MAASSLWLPLIYVSSLAILFSLFARYNKSRQYIHDHSSSYFPIHLAKYEYEELAEQFSPETESGKMAMTQALVKRAVEDVKRVLRIREEKPPLQQMVREGIVGEDLLDKIVRAEQELEDELQQVIEDSEMYRPGWGKTIFQEVSNIAQKQIQELAKQEASARMEEEMEEKKYSEQFSSSNVRETEKSDSKTYKNRNSENKENATTSNLSEEIEEERIRIEQELLEQEELEKQMADNKGKSGKDKGKGQVRRKKK